MKQNKDGEQRVLYHVGETMLPVHDSEALKAQIRAAFATVIYPGDWCLPSSNEQDEPYLVEDEFKGETESQGDRDGR